MAELVEKLSKKELAKLETKIKKAYSEAAKDMQKTIDAHWDLMKSIEAGMQAMVDSKKITEEELKQWRLTYLARGKNYESLRDSLAERATKANELAVSYVNDKTPTFYSIGRNATAYSIELNSPLSVDFQIIPDEAVSNLLVNNPDLMPSYPPKKALKRGIDLAYGKEQIGKTVTSAILQGQSIGEIADTLQEKLTTMNRASALRTARTSTMSALNAGTNDSLLRAKAIGLDLQKQWMTCMDLRTRPEHALADGQIVDVDKPFIVGGEKLQHPQDHSGSAWNIYNCRCTERAYFPDSPYVGETVKGYKEWEAEKYANKDYYYVHTSSGTTKIVTDTGIANYELAGRVEAGGRFVNDSERLYRYAENVKPVDGYTDFTCHADTSSFIIYAGDNQTEEIILSPEEYAEAIKNSKTFTGGNIRLISCQSGAIEDGAAQRVADYLNVSVLAPTEIVNLDENGNMFICNNDTLADIWYNASQEERSKMKEPGKWVLFTPKGE